MVDNLDSALPEQKVGLCSSFSCPACNSGAEKYSELFDHGICVNCGNPLEQFDATLTETGKEEIKRSLLLLYSKDDMAKTAENVIAELKQNGIKVIDAHGIIDGSQTSVASANLSFVMEEAAGVLVIPSHHLEDDAAISTCLDFATMKRVVKGSTRLMPIYTHENISGKKPFGLCAIMGADWDGQCDSMFAGVEKSKAIDYFKELVDKNASK